MPSAPRARDELSAIPAYQAGKDASATAVKLSSNENPFPPLPGVQAAIADAAASVNRYPDFGSTRLLSTLADRLDVDQTAMTLGTGSVAVLGQVLTAMAGSGDEVVMPWRSFEAYPILVQLTGATQVRVPLRADHTHDIDAMLGAVTPRTKVLLLCTPNNPTGTVVTRAEVEQVLEGVPEQVLVVIDEAYVEFVRDGRAPDTLDLAKRRTNVIVLRTFSKAYGLAGLRVGYGIGAPDVIAGLRKAQLPFGVTAMAEQAAIAAISGEPELLRRVDVLVAERDRVERELRAVPIDAPASQGNFVWLPLAERSVDFGTACERDGVVVRPFAGEGVRVTIGEAHANDRWLATLKRFTASS